MPIAAAVVNENDQDTRTLNELKKALADLAIETAKAQTFHWNVTGMSFGPLHSMFQEIYEDHFAAQDDLAERIKAIGGHADGRQSSSLKHSSIDECDGTINARQMVEQLVDDQRALSANLLDLAKTAEREGDAVTNDLAIGRAGIHDKFAWILKAHLAN